MYTEKRPLKFNGKVEMRSGLEIAKPRKLKTISMMTMTMIKACYFVKKKERK